MTVHARKMGIVAAKPQAMQEPLRWWTVPSGLAKGYPIAALALAGIVAGTLLASLQIPGYRYAFAGVSIGCGLPLVLSTARNMLKGRFFVDTVAALAIVAATLMGEYVAGAMVVLMQAGGEALEDYGLRRANRSLDNLLRRAPSIAHVQRNGAYLDIPAGEVAVGEILMIRPGDIIASDGLVTEGTGSVDESALTGEPVPLAKLPGEKVFSGTVNLAGSFLIRSTNTAAQSKYELIVRMVQRAQGEKAPINRLANQYTPAFTLLTLAVSTLAYAATHDSSRALAVLVVATPCPLIIATPLAVLSAINKAASMNIIVKSGAAIEQAGVVDAIVFDKTGTLTSGQPVLSEIHCYAGETPTPNGADDLLQSAAGVELHSVHVLAGAVVHAARSHGAEIEPGKDIQESPGTGVSGNVHGRRVVIGSGAYVSASGIDIADSQMKKRIEIGADGKTVAYVGIDGKLAGMLVFEDRIRPEAQLLVKRLSELGIRQTVMLTGDAPETANSVARQIGIEDARARLHPEDKLAAIAEMSKSHRTMMVGDGINDAPALAAANVGVAMGGYGAGIATDAADIVITVENVERVADVVEIGRKMTSVAKQGIFFGIGASVVLMVVASFGGFPPTVGAVLQEVVDLAAILNALRAR
jgi:heavy metal translocating P-type ATPase